MANNQERNDKIRKLRATGMTLAEIGKQFGLTPGMVSLICDPKKMERLKVCMKAYQATPQRKAYQEMYRATPQYKAYRKVYTLTPEYKARKKEYDKARYLRKKAERLVEGK